MFRNEVEVFGFADDDLTEVADLIVSQQRESALQCANEGVRFNTILPYEVDHALSV